MSDWRWIFWIVGIFAILRVAPVLAMIPALLRMRLRPYGAVIVDAAFIDSPVSDWLVRTAEPLIQLGFVAVGYGRVHDVLDAGSDGEVQLFLRHPNSGAFATIMPAQIPDYRLPSRIDLDTPLSDGRLLTTLNALGHSVIGEQPESIIHSVNCMTERELWDEHRERLAELPQPEFMTIAGFLERVTKHAASLLRHMRDEGRIAPGTQPDRFRLRLPTVLRLAWKMARGNVQRERFLAKRGREISEGRIATCSVEVWQETEAYLRAIRGMRNPIDRSDSLALLFGSAAAFGVAMSAIFGAFGVLCLLGVVAFHELGHWAAMRLFRYRDTSVFFVPFLGAATTGRKPNATLSQEMIVLLAGPLPGITVGLTLAIARPDLLGAGLGLQAIAMLLGINILNLLPVLPLDGGRVVERLLLAGRPKASLLVSSAGVAGFLALAVWARDPILMAFCALFALSLRSHFRGMRLLQRVRAAAPLAATEEERARATFEALAEGDPRPFVGKVGLAQLVETHWIHRSSSLAARGAWLVGYATSLALAIGGSLFAIAAARATHDNQAVRDSWLDTTETQVVSRESPGVPCALAKIGEGQPCPWSSSTQPNASYRTLPRNQLLFPMINSPPNARFSQTKKLRFHSRTG
jgi:Zn-dependent protease